MPKWQSLMIKLVWSQFKIWVKWKTLFTNQRRPMFVPSPTYDRIFCCPCGIGIRIACFGTFWYWGVIDQLSYTKLKNIFPILFFTYLYFIHRFIPFNNGQSVFQGLNITLWGPPGLFESLVLSIFVNSSINTLLNNIATLL